MRRMILFLMVLVLVGCGDDALVPAAEPGAVEPTAAVPATAEEPAPEATLPPTTAEEPAPQTGGVLPAPLYLLSDASGSTQIWRIEADGVTTQQITEEPEPINEYAVSPDGDTVVYVIGNSLVRVNLQGERIVLFEAAPQDPNDPLAAYGSLHSPRWSPDGSEIMVAYGGLAVIPATGGEMQLLIPNTLQTNPELVDIFPVEFVFVPISWSPSGDRMLITKAYVPEGGEVHIVDRQTLETVELNNERGVICCAPRWSADGSSIIFANDTFGMFEPGLWRADANTGEIQSIIESDPQNGPWLRASNPTLLADGTIRAFAKREEEFLLPDGSIAPLFMADIAADGTLTELRSDPFMVQEALWFADGSAVVVDANTTGRMAVFPVDGAPEIDLPLVGRSLRWGR